MIYKIIIKIITGRYCCAIKMIDAIEDRFLLCVGTHTADETGGEEIHTLIIDKLPSHSHQYKRHSFNTK